MVCLKGCDGIPVVSLCTVLLISGAEKASCSLNEKMFSLFRLYYTYYIHMFFSTSSAICCYSTFDTNPNLNKNEKRKSICFLKCCCCCCRQTHKQTDKCLVTFPLVYNICMYLGISLWSANVLVNS